MRTLFIIPLVLMSLMSFPSWGLTMDDLVNRSGVTYKKFSDIPFSGEVTGQWRGVFKNGRMEGLWVKYWSNGQLHFKGNHRNGKHEGYWEYYLENGQLDAKGNYKNGKQEGYWVFDNVYNDHTGTYKNDVRVSD
jgi:hypothetical protein